MDSQCYLSKADLEDGFKGAFALFIGVCGGEGAIIALKNKKKDLIQNVFTEMMLINFKSKGSC